MPASHFVQAGDALRNVFVSRIDTVLIRERCLLLTAGEATAERVFRRVDSPSAAVVMDARPNAQ